MPTLPQPVEAEWTSDAQPHPGRRMTEEEFVEWVGEKTRAEWVDGEVIVMSPVRGEHDVLVAWPHSVVRPFVRRNALGEVRGPEFTARLGPERRRRLPDLLFVAESRRGILRRNHVEGAPDLTIEIVSPDSVARDWRDKYLDYQAAGVREDWVIDPMSERAELYRLDDRGIYQPVEEKDGKVVSAVLPGFYLRPSWLWQGKHPDEVAALQEMGLSF